MAASPFEHALETQAAVFRLAHQLVQAGHQPDLASVYRLLQAVDRVASAGLWLVVHMTYAQQVHLDGTPLAADDFKTNPEGHTGGALNMVPAYAGYLALNALTGRTRAWLMGQGHCVAAVDALNLLTGNLHPEQAQAYAGGEAGINRLLQDSTVIARPPMAAHWRRWAVMSIRIPPVGLPKAVIWASLSFNMPTCRCPARRWWRSCPMVRPKNSAAATGFHAGGGPRIAAWRCQ